MWLEVLVLIGVVIFCIFLMAIALYSLDNIISCIREEIWGEQPVEDRVKSWLKKK